MSDKKMVQVNVPSHLASKRLKITNPTGRRKVQISTNFLPFFGFEPDTPVIERSLGAGKGYVIELANGMPAKKKIYSREYRQRRNSPFETVSETTSKKILDEAIPPSTEVVHVTFTHGRIIVKPIVNAKAERINKVLNSENPLSVFAACTSGVDAHAASSEGFKIQSVLEWRPEERRDRKSLTETGALTAMANVEVEQLFNEDIGAVSTEYLAWATQKNPATLFTVSLQCDDFSLSKAKSLKEKSLLDLSSTLDMAYDALRIIEKLQFPMVLLEQVPLFENSDVGKMWDLRLRRMGYETTSVVLDARSYDGLTSRKRYFHFATSLPIQFEWPEAKEWNKETLFEKLILDRMDDFRDISHTSSMKKGLETGRLRIINSESTYAPTILKSQSRQAKDSCVIQKDTGEILFPDEKLLKDLMGIPDEFDLSAVNAEQASEQIGQAVDYPLYAQIMRQVKKHVSEFVRLMTPKGANVLAA